VSALQHSLETARRARGSDAGDAQESSRVVTRTWQLSSPIFDVVDFGSAVDFGTAACQLTALARILRALSSLSCSVQRALR
jgi:hypothetical protein